VLEEERELDLAKYPDRYHHVWEAEYARAFRGALGFYHEKKDEQRDVGLGPEHDWSSHAADAFGLMAIAYEEPSRLAAFNQPLDWSKFGRGIVYNGTAERGVIYDR
jgi:hypothetical protein